MVARVIRVVFRDGVFTPIDPKAAAGVVEGCVGDIELDVPLTEEELARYPEYMHELLKDQEQWPTQRRLGWKHNHARTFRQRMYQFSRDDDE